MTRCYGYAMGCDCLGCLQDEADTMPAILKAATLNTVAAGAGAERRPPRGQSAAVPGAPAATPSPCRCGARSVIRYTWPQATLEAAYCARCALLGLSWEPALRFALTYGMGASL